MTKPKILVTGAAGRTASTAVLELLESGFPVRAFVRRADARSERLRAAGAEIFVGNLFDFEDLRRAMDGVQRAYHCPPFTPHLLNNAMMFALAAEEAKLEVVALMSGWNPHPTHPSLPTREHWMVNNLYRWMPTVEVIHINPGIFAFMYLLGLPAIVNFGVFMAPFGAGLNAPPSSEDIGRVAAGVLMKPANHIGKSYRPTGPELISSTDIAAILSRVLDRPVKFQDASMKMFSKAATALGVSTFEIAQMRYYAEEIRQGAYAVGAPTDHVELITGRAPESFETIARRYIAHPDLIMPGLRAMSKLGAVGFILKMLATPAPDLEAWEKAHQVPKLENPKLAHENEEWVASASQKTLFLLPTTSSADTRTLTRRADLAHAE